MGPDDAKLLAKWQRRTRLQALARDRLPQRFVQVLGAFYNHRPEARLDRRGAAERGRIAVEVHRRCGGVVQRGPFVGMRFPFATWDAPAKCIGSYERELHGEVQAMAAHGYPAIINVGCAEGFYAVGFARLSVASMIYAYDLSPEAVASCQALAGANDIRGERMVYGGEVTHAVLDDLCQQPALLVVDIEGAEAELLDPALVPRLAHVDLLVELHHHVVPDIEDLMRCRFEATHDIRLVSSESRDDTETYTELEGLSDHDAQLALFERPIVMRWMILTQRSTDF